jgi:hypothetical protein
MEKTAKVSPKDFFMWLGAMVALVISVTSIIALWFEYIDQLTNSVVASGYDPYSEGIRIAIACLIVMFPLYVFFTRLLNQDIRKHSEKEHLWVRRWLIFLALFISGLTIAIDLIVLINTFLSGEELTAAFLLKVLTVFVVVGGVFTYYLQDIRGIWRTKEKTARVIGVTVSLLIFISIFAGFFIMGTPHMQRLLRFDRDRISHLENIQYAVTDYYRNKQELPQTLEDLEDPLDMRFIESDPETGDAYTYRILETDLDENPKFEVCATFSTASPKLEEGIDISNWRIRELVQQNEQWYHEVGETCFEREVDPDKYQKESALPRPVIIN